MHIPARAEIPAVRPENHHIHIIGIDQIAEPVAQLGIAVKGQRVFAVGAVKAHCGDAVFDLAKEMFHVATHGLGHLFLPYSQQLAPPLSVARPSGGHLPR